MYRGALRFPSQDCKTVAIKTLKDTSPDGQWWNFLREATIMGQFNHPHILRLEGVVTKSMQVIPRNWGRTCGKGNKGWKQWRRGAGCQRKETWAWV